MQTNLDYLSDPIPGIIAVSFAAVTLLTLSLFSLSFPKMNGIRWFVVGSALWLAALGFLAHQGAFLQLDAFPPRMMLAMVPAFVLVLVVGLTPLGRTLSRQASLSALTWLHTVRLPVELYYMRFIQRGRRPSE